jgi:hypothetical protein
VQLLSFEGRMDPADAASVETAIKVGPVLSARAGVRLFRATSFDLDLFVAGHLPLFKTSDPDTLVIDRYTPSLQIGVGVGF